MTEVAVTKSPTASEAAPTVETQSEARANPFRLMLGTIIRPAATFKQLRDAQRGYWWFVLLVTAVTILAVALASSSVEARAVQSFTFNGTGRTGTFGSGNATEAGAARTGSSNQAGGSRTGTANQFAGGTGGTGTTGTRQFQSPSPLILIGLPVAGGIAVTLIDYGLRAVLVFLMSMVLGGKAAFKEVFRMSVWTTLPAAVRRVIQAVAVVLTGGQIAAGFSAALSATEIRTLPIVNLLLGYVDIYTLWSALLLGIGAAITGKLSKGKAAFAVVIYLGVSVVGILVFYAITSAIGGALGGSGTRGTGFPGGAGGGTRTVRPGG